MIRHLSYGALRKKALSCIEKYLNISKKYRISIGLYKNGELYVLGDGGVSLSYDIGSVSKTMTAHLILSLVDKRLVELRARADEYIDELPSGSYPTVGELLTHTAGYGHLTPVEITLPSLLSHGYARKNIYEGCTSDTVVRALARRRRHKDGRGYGYSDFSYAVLAVIAERVTGRCFSELLSEFVRDTLGLTDTVILADEQTREPKSANGKRTLPFWKWNENNPYIAGGGLVSNISDMLRYVALEIESCERHIVGAHRICAASESEHSNIKTCYGWHTYKKSNQLWHVGGVGTFRSSVIINKKKRLGVVVLGNAKGIASANVHYIAKMLYSEMKINKINFEVIL